MGNTSTKEESDNSTNTNNASEDTSRKTTNKLDGPVAEKDVKKQGAALQLATREKDENNSKRSDDAEVSVEDERDDLVQKEDEQSEPFDPDNYDPSKFGPILPNGEINWECPCLGGAASGVCGSEFRVAFSCMLIILYFLCTIYFYA